MAGKGTKVGIQSLLTWAFTWFHFFIVDSMVVTGLSQLFRSSAAGAYGGGGVYTQNCFRQELCRLEMSWVQAERMGRCGGTGPSPDEGP